MKVLNKEISLCVVDNFLDAEEIRDILNEAHDRTYQHSNVVLKDGNGTHPGRTSTSCMFGRSDCDIVRKIEDKVLRMNFGAERSDIEGLQLVRYDLEQKFDPHYDYFDSEVAKSEIQTNGQRQITILCYLIAPQTGGQTVFPNLGVEVHPTMGTAIMWNNTTEAGGSEGSPLTLHGGKPVKSGTKIAMNIWIRGNARISKSDTMNSQSWVSNPQET